MRRTYRSRKPRRKTYRGGTIETVKQIIADTPATGINIINPESKFVVATYWWGRANMNRNLQFPCPEDVMDIAKQEALGKLNQIDPFPKLMTAMAAKIKRVSQTRALTTSEKDILVGLQKNWNEWKAKVLATDEGKRIVAEAYAKVQAEQQAKPGSRPPRGFPDMIREWEEKCRAANVNFVSLNTEFERSDYQNAINGKPLFIKKILDAVAPRAVLYIDGDMWINKYPHIFDLDNVDFMARNWNIDPRSKAKSLEKPAYDPYTFETSGGTMYFGNTPAARRLLDKWFEESTKPEMAGKADDRILSQVFTTQSLVIDTNTIGLPIEYLWLTDFYKTFLKDQNDPASVEDALIEHPYCLTGEERAAEQGASVNRNPDTYEEEVSENIKYKRQPDLFYEYIFFDGNQQMRDEYSRYLRYMKEAKNFFTQDVMLKVVDFAEKYGEFNEIATQNLQGITPNNSGQGQKVSLALDAPIPEILKALYSGSDVELGGPVAGVGPEDEFVGTDGSTRQDGIDMYTRAIRVDTTAPMFLSGKSSTLRHLITMCETIADINKHVQTYTFISRIRWNLSKPAGQPVSTEVGPITVHQIWFGGDMPEWRKYMFEANKKVCEAEGMTYRLWRNEDRTRENFPSTIGYQETAIQKGQSSGQSRWAQVADLARLEIVYNNGGIYIDSLFEISPAFLQGIQKAFAEGYQFIGCNEDPCDPPADCVGNAGNKYLTNSFFAATKFNPVLERLLDDNRLGQIDMESEFINRTTGPYYLRSGIQDVQADKVFLFDSAQIYQFNQQATPYKEAKPNRFLSQQPLPGSIKVRDDMYYVPGGINILQTEFLVGKQETETLTEASKVVANTIVGTKGPIAIYHSGLGGTWST
jgi:hypothetical protein